MVRSDGMVKVLDFGLAKAIDPVAASGAAAVNSLTVTSPAMTMRGMILGTAAYMAPEQARGMAVDRRADLWAFGVIVWEMLTGRRLFDGATVSDTLASVLKTEPQWDALRPDTPSSVRRLLRRCLEKDRRHRLADAADARLEIDDALSGAQGDVPLALAISRSGASLVWASPLGAWRTSRGCRRRMGRAPRARRSGDDPIAREHRAHRADSWSGSAGATRGRAAADTHRAFPVAGREDAGLRGDLGWRSTAVRARDEPTQCVTDCGHEWRAGCLPLARRAMGRLLGSGQATEGSSRRRPCGAALRCRSDLRGQLGQRRHHRLCDRPERRLVARVGGWRDTPGTHDASGGRVQSPVAPRAARRPRRHLHDPKGGAAME